VSTPEVTDPLDLNGWLSRTRWPGIMDTGETDDMPIFTGEAEQDDAVVRGGWRPDFGVNRRAQVLASVGDVTR
jgi:hypothetical protein